MKLQNNAGRPGIGNLIALVYLLALWLVLAIGEHDLLLRIEQHSLFLTGADYFRECMKFPAGFLTYSACFLNQSLHYPLIGALLFAGLLGALYFTTCKAFRINGNTKIAALIPISLIVAANMAMGYLMFRIKGQGWFFTTSIATLLATSAVWMFRKLQSPYSVIWVMVWSVAGYILTGVWALVGTLCMATVALRRKAYATGIIAAIVAGVTAPLCSLLYTTTKVTASLSVGLFGIPFVGNLWNFIPLLALALTLVLLSLFIQKDRTKMKGKLRATAEVVTPLLAAVAIPMAFWNMDPNFRAEQQMSVAIENGNWEKVVQIHSDITAKHAKSDQKAYEKRSQELKAAQGADTRQEIIDRYDKEFYKPSRLMVMYKNLALLRLGKAGDLAFAYKDGDRFVKGNSQLPIVYQCGMPIYLNYGYYNHSYRWSMELSVEYGWSAETEKYAIMSQILAGNYGLALKHIERLSHSPIYSGWARLAKGYIDNPASLQESELYGFMTQMKRSDNFVRAEDNEQIEPFLINTMLAERPQDASAVHDEVAMQFALQSQDIEAFWHCFNNWLVSHPGQQRIPLHYQEAAYLYAQLEGDVDLNSFPIEKSVRESYDAFTKFTQTVKVSNKQEAQYLFEKRFGKTFYYYYFFIRDQRTN